MLDNLNKCQMSYLKVRRIRGENTRTNTHTLLCSPGGKLVMVVVKRKMVDFANTKSSRAAALASLTCDATAGISLASNRDVQLFANQHRHHSSTSTPPPSPHPRKPSISIKISTPLPTTRQSRKPPQRWSPNSGECPWSSPVADAGSFQLASWR